MTSLRIASLALMALVSMQAGAADPGFYFGISGGRAKYDFDKLHFPVATPTLPPAGGIIPSFQPPPFPSSRFGSDIFYVVTVSPAPVFTRVISISPFVLPGADHEDHDTSWSGLVGYRVNRYLAAELNYVNLGELEARETIYLYPTFAPIERKYSLETRGGTVALLGILPLMDNWDVHVRVGGFMLDSKLGAPIGASRQSATFGSEGFVYGIGTQFSFGDHWSVRLDFQRYDSVGDRTAPAASDIDNLSLGVLYRL